MSKLLLVAVLVVGVILAGYFGLASVLHNLDKPSSLNQKAIQQQVEETPQTSNKTQGSSDQGLIGNWDTGCLVPDPKSPWAERHTFTLNSNGTGIHKRYSSNTCEKLTEDLTDDLNWVIPSAGKINLSYKSGMAAGYTLYDIYEVSGNTLKFGHGFRTSYTGASKITGENEANRFDTLNTFLIYKK